MSVIPVWQYLGCLAAAHVIGDFPFQSPWMVMEKLRKDKDGKPDPNYEVLMYHVLAYLTPMMVLSLVPGFHITPQGMLVNGVTHFVIDTLKCHGNTPFLKEIWQDQLWHATVIFTLWGVGWL